MESTRTYSADTEAALWQQVAADLALEENQYEYRAELLQGGYRINFELDIDLGGGFEGGYELTTFSAVVPGQPSFHFALHEQDWVHELGKLLGLTDVELGDPDLDAAFIITTNDAVALRMLLNESAVRATLLKYQELRLTLAPASHEPGAEVLLTFTKEEGITDPAQLQEIYHMLYLLLQRLTPASAGTAISNR
ncbi:hypothetical protein DNI29_13270 [Hymenobacter sediminis]|uniref:hypothetical protein n=1 Tax=Hymenobacter sediminis TaxID=2218621 RepID=UPI000DA694DF|nr:hypothetical protein [Hymenobacter sediminis]RPD47114.1 hypothetical protein DNI29_13270 [Hymenobacter sediminis]